jgi:hypothetical protein
MFSNIKAENVCENLKKKFADAEKSEWETTAEKIIFIIKAVSGMRSTKLAGS